MQKPMTDYRDIDGNPASLEQLCRDEPQWAATQIARLRERVGELERGIPTVDRHIQDPEFRELYAEEMAKTDCMEAVAERDEARAAADAAVRWWESRRPLAWTEYQHMQAPRVNTADEAAAELATMVAQYVGARNIDLDEPSGEGDG